MTEEEISAMALRLQVAADDRRSARDRFERSSETLAEVVRQASDLGMSNRQIKVITKVAPETIRAWIRG